MLPPGPDCQIAFRARLPDCSSGRIGQFEYRSRFTRLHLPIGTIGQSVQWLPEGRCEAVQASAERGESLPDCLPLDYICINGNGHLTELPDLQRCQIATLATLPDCQIGSTARLPDRLLDLVNRAIDKLGMPDCRITSRTRLPECFQNQIARLLPTPNWPDWVQIQIGQIGFCNRDNLAIRAMIARLPSTDQYNYSQIINVSSLIQATFGELLPRIHCYSYCYSSIGSASVRCNIYTYIHVYILHIYII